MVELECICWDRYLDDVACFVDSDPVKGAGCQAWCHITKLKVNVSWLDLITAEGPLWPGKFIFLTDMIGFKQSWRRPDLIQWQFTNVIGIITEEAKSDDFVQI